MQCTTNDYADFLLLFVGLGSGTVFYHDGGSTDFQITAFTINGVLIRANSMGAKPGSFNTDFPQAIALAANPTFP